MSERRPAVIRLLAPRPRFARRARRRLRFVLGAAAAIAAGATPLAAQYTLSPTPVLPLNLFSRSPGLAGYVSARETMRGDTATFTVNRARITLHVLPVRFAAVRIQADFSSIGRTSGDTVPATLLTDAYVELVLPDTSGAVARVLRPALVVGQFRTPFSLEYLTGFSTLTTANRSLAVDRLSTRRDLGVLAQLRLAHAATLTGAIVNGEGPNRLANPDGKQMAVGRLTLSPVRSLAVSAKWLGQGGDHRWGYDARWLARRLIVEGEVIERTAPAAAGGAFEANGGYALAAFKVRPWLQPVVKWERLRETTTVVAAVTERQVETTTYGLNLVGPDEHLRLQLDWLVNRARPVRMRNELVAQLQAVF